MGQEYSLDISGAIATWRKLDTFTRAYIEAAMWTLTNNDSEPCDDLTTLEDIAPSTILAAIRDCKAFREQAGTLLDESDESQAGHDFLLTRDGHGVGFWDRDEDTYPNDPKGEKLTELAHSFGESNWCVGDDGLVYQMGAEPQADPRQSGDDDGVEYADPRDERDERERR